MLDRTTISQRVASLRRRWLDLTIAGHVVGGRPGEALMRVAECEVDDETVRITFDRGERLTVVRPSGVAAGGGVLSIPWAAEVRLTWGASAPPPLDADRSEVVCTAADGAAPGPGQGAVVHVAVSGPARASWSPQGRYTLGRGEPMVRLG